MLEIDFYDEHQLLTAEQRTTLHGLLNLASQVLKLAGNFEVDITILTDTEIEKINATYRHVDRPTDVLSFPMQDGTQDETVILGLPKQFPIALGDIFVSYETCQAQAIKYGHSFARELGFLVLHGFLHLNGFDHDTKAHEAEMFALQNDILDRFGLGRNYE